MGTVSIRLQGFAEDVNAAIRALEQIPGVQIIRQSREYLDRNSTSVRKYLDIEVNYGGAENE